MYVGHIYTLLRTANDQNGAFTGYDGEELGAAAYALHGGVWREEHENKVSGRKGV